MESFKLFQILGQTYNADKRTAYFHYGFDDTVKFTETLIFPGEVTLPDEEIKKVLFHIGLALGVGYYKLYPTEYIRVHNGKLTAEQEEFWQTFYIQGLGEFFYTNEIDPTGLANFVSEGEYVDELIIEPEAGYLVPIGGGKDSNVTLSLLEEAGLSDQVRLFTNGRDYKVHQEIERISGLPRSIVDRKLDPQLFEMNAQGYYNGHIPITGMISFISLLTALLTGNNHIVFSNERSANFGNTTWKGYQINHQRSKSYSFELAFAAYVKKYISEELHYFSLLRPWHELRMAEKMSTLKEYLPVFTSCNKNFRISGPAKQLRCGSCPKCYFTYLILRPFLTQDEAMSIRGKEYYAGEQLLENFQQLWGVEGFKPFECVGTYEESKVATRMATQDDKLKELPVVAWFDKHIASKKSPQERKDLQQKLLDTQEDALSNIPEELQKYVS